MVLFPFKIININKKQEEILLKYKECDFSAKSAEGLTMHGRV